MLENFKTSRRILFFPVKWANSVTNWCLGLNSPSGTIRVRNTANPTKSGAAIDVDMNVVTNRIREALANVFVLTRSFNEMLLRHIDSKSIVQTNGVISVNEAWLSSMIGGGGTGSVNSVDGVTPDLNGNVQLNALTDSDIGSTVAAFSHTHTEYAAVNHTHSGYATTSALNQVSQAVETLSGIVDGILEDYVTSQQLTTALSGYSRTNHTHTGYAPASHTHSQYALVDHSHTHRYITDFDTAVKDVADSYYATINHTHSGYALVDHTHTGYAPASHTHSEYAITSHTHTEYAAASHTHSEYAAVGHTHSEYATASVVQQLTTIVEHINDTYITAGDLDGYATEQWVQSQGYITEAELGDTYATKVWVQSQGYVTDDELADYITKDEIPQDFITAIASRKSGTFTLLTNIQFDGTNLQKKTQAITVTQGVITNIGTESSWTTWHTPTVITWS